MFNVQTPAQSIGVKNQLNVDVNQLLIENGASLLLTTGIGLGVVLVGVLGAMLNKKVSEIGERLKRDVKYKKIKDEDIEIINNLLYGLLYEYEAIRVFILEFHNGTVTGNGYSYEKVSMTYEVASIGYIKMATTIQDIPRSLIIEELIKVKDGNTLELREQCSTNPLLKYGNEVIFLRAINQEDINKGCVGISFQSKGFSGFNEEELENTAAKIKQIFR